MTDTRVVYKSLAGEEDLLYGEGIVSQSRNGGAYDITKVRTLRPVNSLAELNALDTDRFVKAVLIEGGVATIYAWSGTAWEAQIVDPRIDTQDTYADVRALTASYPFETIIVGGASVVGVGGGTFYLDPADVVSPDNGGTILVDAGGRRWKRIYSDAVNVLWFGATGDGVTDDSAAINAAISFVSILGGGTLFVPDGAYLIANPIELMDYLELVFSRGAEFLQGADGINIIQSSTHAYFTAIRNPQINGNGFNGGVAFALNNFRLESGIYDASITDIENGLYLLGGCFGAAIDNFTAYNGCLNPIVIIENAATAVINNPNLDNVTGRWAGLGYGIHVQGAGIPNEGVIINGGYAQGYVRGIWDSGRGTRIQGTYFEQCTEADVYWGGAIQSSAFGTQHFAGVGAAAYKARSSDGCSVILPNMGSGGRTVLYDVDATNTNFTEFRAGSATFDNTPLGSMTYVTSISKQTKFAFTPVVVGSTVAGTATYIEATGTACLDGTNVSLEIDLAWNGHTGTGALVVLGLPSSLTPASYIPRRLGFVATEGFAITGPQVYANFTGSSTDVRLVEVSAAGATALVTVPVAGAVAINMMYSL
jgi:hypothetical protein